MSKTATAPEILWSKDVACAADAVLKVTRTASDAGESITGQVAATAPFGNWRTNNDPAMDAPTIPDIESAVSEAIGFPVSISLDPDGDLDVAWEGDAFTMKFLRDSIESPTTPPVVVQQIHSDAEGLLARIERQAEIVQALRLKWKEAKKKASELRDELDEESALHEKLSLSRKENLPLFDAQPVPAAPALVNGQASTAPAGPAAPAASAPAIDEKWKAVKIEQLPGLTEAMVNNLREANIDNVGQWCVWVANGHLPKVKGIGPEKMTKLEDAVTAWIEEQRKAEQAAAAPAPIPAVAGSIEPAAEAPKTDPTPPNTPPAA